MSRRTHREVPSAGFRGDLRRMLRDLKKQTSASHKRLVLFIILCGVALRASLLLRPISYEEAMAFVDYATLPISGIVSDYKDPANHVFHTLLTKLSTAVLSVGRFPLRLPAFIAGVLTLPLFYLFVRSMFNRYIAVISLALVAASGPLVEYSAIARGYSIAWLCFMLALLLGRHLIRSNSSVSAIGIGVVSAFGMWSVPSMAYAAIMVHVWILFSLMAKYENTLRQRITPLFVSLVVFVLLTVLLYLPVIMEHGVDQLLHHRTVVDQGWKSFVKLHQDRYLDLWAYIVDSSASWVGVLGFIGFFYAAFISSKFRFLAGAMLVGAVPLVLIQTIVGPPPVWLYILFIMHLSTGIALFYALKLIQEKLIPNMGKRSRTALTALILLIGFGWSGMREAWKRTEGMPEARLCVERIKKSFEDGDRLYAEYPWDAPMAFNVLALGMDRAALNGDPAPEGTSWVAVSEVDEQTLVSVLRHHGQDASRPTAYSMVLERNRLRIFADRIGEQ